MCSPAQRADLQLAAQHLGRVDLDHDLRVEVVPGVQVEVGVSVAGEAVHACVTAPAIRIDRPAERDPRGRRHLADQAARVDLMERDAAEARRIEGASDDRGAAEEHILARPAGPGSIVRPARLIWIVRESQ